MARISLSGHGKTVPTSIPLPPPLKALLKARADDPAAADALWARVRGPRPDLSGGYQYRQLERMPYYVNKDAYTAALKEHLEIVSPA